MFTRQLQIFSSGTLVDPFGVAFGVIPVRRNDSLPGKGFSLPARSRFGEGRGGTS
jgi:hypothetical protein